MTQVCNKRPATPRQALRRATALDRALDVELFKALGEPVRAKLVACIAKCGRGCSVSETSECCDIDISVVSRHLGQLARAGVLEGTKRGRTVYYRVRAETVAATLRAIADALEECCRDDSEERDGCC